MLQTTSGQVINRVAVLYGGWAHETNYAAYPLVIPALQSFDLDVASFDIRDPHFIMHLQEASPDVAFPTNQGANCMDGKIQGLLEILNIPYVGCGVCASAVGINKLVSKLAFQGLGIQTPRYMFCPYGSQASYAEIVNELGSPFVVKPLMAGSSFGIDLVKDEETFRMQIPHEYSEFGDLLMEEYIDGEGVEYTVGIIEDDVHTIQLPICEIRSSTELLSLATKHNIEQAKRIVPADLDATTAERMKQIAFKIHTLLGCHSMSRTDMLMTRNGDIYVLEVNTFPGLLSTSFIPLKCQAIGISYEQMIAMLVKSAFKRRPMEVPRIYENLPTKPGKPL